VLALLAHIRRYRHVLRNFVVRDLKVKYRGTVFGYLWTLLEPLSLVAVYWFVFVVIAERGGPDYPLVVILGVLPFQFLSAVISGGTGILVGNAALIRRVYLPRELFVVALVLSNLVTLALSLLVTVPFLIAYDVSPGWRLAYLPVALGLLAALALGVSLVLACVHAMYRDVAYVVKVVLRLAFYGSPVIYSVGMVPEHIRGLYLLNPVAVYLEMARSAVMNTPFLFDGGHAALAAVIALSALALGARLFRRLENKAVKFL
jgi:ABC-2 type transport system permease protein